jgi:hypothetical protein
MSEQRETPPDHLEDLASATSALSEQVALLAETVQQRDYKITLERLLATVQIIRQRIETTPQPQPEQPATVSKDLSRKLGEMSVQMRAILQEVQQSRTEARQRHDEHVQEQRKQRAGRDAWIMTMILVYAAGVLTAHGIQLLI